MITSSNYGGVIRDTHSDPKLIATIGPSTTFGFVAANDAAGG